MPLNSEEIFLRLMSACNTKTLKKLSEQLGYRYNWATTTRNRNVVPWEACAKVSQEKGISLDYLIFGSEQNNNALDGNELRLSIAEGLFAAIQTNMISLEKDVKISHITEIITSEIKEGCNINADLKQKAE